MNYFKIYYNLLNKALLEKRVKSPEIYYEAHHAKPECKGGKFLVLLTGREHFVAHLLLTKIYKKDYQLASAFNKMFSKSYWYEYKRKLFSENHPLKNPIVLKKHKKAMAEYYLSKSIGKFCEFTKCVICSNITYKAKAKYCSEECLKNIGRKSYIRSANTEPSAKELKLISEGKDCIICGKKHLRKYCCSKACFLIYTKQDDNEYSENLSNIHKNMIKQSKRGNNMSTSSNIKIYNNLNELIYESLENEGFINMCEINNIPYKLFQSSYLSKQKINISSMSLKNKEKYKTYDGWYAIKINNKEDL